MDPSEISLRTPSRDFEYERLSRDVDKIEDIEGIRTMLKSYIKLYLKQQETIKMI